MVLLVIGYDEEESKALANKVMDDWETAKNEGLPYVIFLPEGTKLNKNEGDYVKGSWVVGRASKASKTFEPEVLQIPRLLIIHGLPAEKQQTMANELMTTWEQCIQNMEPFQLDIPVGVTVGSFPGQIRACSVFTPRDGPPEVHIEMSENMQRSGQCEL